MDTVLNIGRREQVLKAVERVFNSWNNARAVEYRRLHAIPSDLGTAVIIQAMVMGNLNERSGTGVVFTRNPVSGERGLYEEYMPQAQGEEVVSGQRNPYPVELLRSSLPQLYEQLLQVGQALERHYRDMQDIELTVEDGRLYVKFPFFRIHDSRPTFLKALLLQTMNSSETIWLIVAGLQAAGAEKQGAPPRSSCSTMESSPRSAWEDEDRVGDDRVYFIMG